jgi:RimJ/RimL family protein N-acetyltransferase
MTSGNKIYTIGYAGTTLPRFVDILKGHNISHLIDVRSIAKSQYFSAFNDTNLKSELPKYGIAYLHFKNEFGARQGDPRFYTNGVMDFEKFSKSEQFKSGIEKVNNYLAENKTVCLMCAEIDPLDCHRAILCARALDDSEIAIEHIVARRSGEVTTESQNALEKRLLELYKKQTDDPQTAYKLHNQKIGYKLEGGTLFTTERLVIRQWRAGDACDLFEILTSDIFSTLAVYGWKRVETREDVKAIIGNWMERYKNNCGDNETTKRFCPSQKVQWAVVSKCGNKVVGTFGMSAADEIGEIEVGCVLGADYRAWGYGTEILGGAFAYLATKCKSVIAETTIDNVGAIRVMEKAGMVKIETQGDPDYVTYKWVN